jgi:ubiquinone/menaquinone biosynthesis C-methylase UbiE
MEDRPLTSSSQLIKLKTILIYQRIQNVKTRREGRNMDEKAIKEMVKEGYGKVARQGGSCCGSGSSCCGTADLVQNIGRKIGYSEEELRVAPEGANLGLGCGNPVALASLREGETVLDLGSGAGFDSFLAASKVGKSGKVIGVDMTPEMIEKARENAGKGNYTNVEFRLGEIEKLPVSNNSVDLVMSNCVINLSPDKAKVFQEALRVLKPGGRMMISDIVLLRELPKFIKESVEAYIGCVSGAILKDEYLAKIKSAGFEETRVIDESIFPVEFITNDPMIKKMIEDSGLTSEQVEKAATSAASIKVHAVKPE